MNADYCG
jgi:hypothetical protein